MLWFKAGMYLGYDYWRVCKRPLTVFNHVEKRAFNSRAFKYLPLVFILAINGLILGY